MERRPVDVNAVVREIAAAARDAYAAQLHLQLQPDVDSVLGDPIALRRILDNLMVNGVQSLAADGGSVTISTERRDHLVRITVADTGRGMTEDEVTRALGGFYTTKPRGTGLGLSVVRRLVADHDGDVQIDTTPGRGTTVIVELPAHSTPSRRSGATHS
jgi:two-component system sensor histidine kinase AtoS